MESFELMPGMLSAIDEGRLDDAIHLAQEALDNEDNAAVALLSAISFANYLHKNPNMSSSAVAAMLATGEIETSEMRDGDLGLDFLTALDEYNEDGTFSDIGEQVLGTYDMRPGSSMILRMAAMATRIVMVDVQMVMSPPFNREPDVAYQFALADARSILAGNGKLPLPKMQVRPAQDE